MELNPNNQVTRAASGQWHKIAAAIMVQQGLTELKIEKSTVHKLAEGNVNIVLDARGRDLVIRIVGDKAAADLARKEGGRTCDN